MADNSLFEDIRKNADIVKIISTYIPVIKKSKAYVAICPFHDDSSPSLQISPEKQICKCFACGTSANAISFIQKYEHIPFMEAAKKCAEISGYHDPRLEIKTFTKKEPTDTKKADILKCLHDLTTFYSYQLATKEGQEGLQYLESRHLDNKLRTKYKLGYCSKDGKASMDFLLKKGHSLSIIEETGVANILQSGPLDKNRGRVIFPICDQNGDVIGYSARRIANTDEAKYVNSPETYVFHKSSVLYNYHIAKEACKHAGYVYLLEGFMDVYALSRIGIDSAIALMGTALTNEHIQMIRRLNVEVRLCLDGDEAGQNAMMKSALLLKKAGISFRLINNQNSPDDPDEIVNKNGPEALKSYLNNLLNYDDFILNYYQNTKKLVSSEDKRQLILNFIPMLKSLKSTLEQDDYIRKLAKVTNYDVESIRKVVNDYNVTKSSEGVSQSYVAKDFSKHFHPEQKRLQHLLLCEKEVLYQMTLHKNAVSFYENRIPGFYNDIYRQLANFIIEYSASHDNIEASDLITMVENSDVPNKDELADELSSITMEPNHVTECDDKLLEDLYNSITKEREKISLEDAIENSLKGKSEIEKARILDAYNKQKMTK